MTSHHTEKRTIQERLRDQAGHLYSETDNMLAEAAGRIDALEKALREIKSMRSEEIGDTGFYVGPLALLNACQRIARSALHPSDESLGQEGGGEGE